MAWVSLDDYPISWRQGSHTREGFSMPLPLPFLTLKAPNSLAHPPSFDYALLGTQETSMAPLPERSRTAPYTINPGVCRLEGV